MNLICRAWKHSPMDFTTEAGVDVVICRRCGADISEWDAPFIGQRTKAALWTCLGTGVTTYAATDVTVLGTERALQVAAIAALAALCMRFGESKVGAK